VRWRRFAQSLAVLVALAGIAWAIDTVWRDRSYPNEKAILQGVPNFGRIKPHLYRGGQPSEEGFAGLRALGIDTVISFTLGEEGARAESDLVGRLGMRHIALPWSAEEVPQPDQVGEFLEYLRDHPDRTVFVHCKAGADRTGVMIALSRIAIDGWPTQKAVDEMNAFHYHFIFLPHLQRFVERFTVDVPQ
jgi:protein tyrosine/serine phosphatase